MQVSPCQAQTFLPVYPDLFKAIVAILQGFSDMAGSLVGAESTCVALERVRLVSCSCTCSEHRDCELLRHGKFSATFHQMYKPYNTASPSEIFHAHAVP